MANPRRPPKDRGKQYKKNRRTRKAKQRKKAATERASKYISTEPKAQRTLTAANRKQLRREIDRNNIIFPWVSEINYKYLPRTYPAASLMGLPTELRVKILLQTVDIGMGRIIRKAKKTADDGLGDTKMGGVDNENDHEVLRELHPSEIASVKKWIGDLNCVCPRIRMEVEYIGKQWRHELRVHLDAQLEAQNGNIRSRTLSWMDNLQWLSPDYVQTAAKTFKQGKQIKGKLGKGKFRPQKCWFCEQRHYGENPECIKLLGEWKSKSKPVNLKGQHRKNKVLERFLGRKIVFED